MKEREKKSGGKENRREEIRKGGKGEHIVKGKEKEGGSKNVNMEKVI